MLASVSKPKRFPGTASTTIERSWDTLLPFLPLEPLDEKVDPTTAGPAGASMVSRRKSSRGASLPAQMTCVLGSASTA